MQALMLAAGMGKRLGKYTKENTKSMVEVSGQKLIDRAVDALVLAGIKKLIIVVGYCGENLINYVKTKYQNSDMTFEFINNKDYAKTNNIYSFYLAKEYLKDDDTILMESDLIYDPTIIKKLIDSPHKNIATIAKYESYMDGTVVTVDKDGFIKEFVDKNEMDLDNLKNYYKTVNIYKLSKEFCTNIYIPFLEAYMKAYGVDSYYETTLKAIAHLSKTKMYGFDIGALPWYEIDDALDLDTANVLFNKQNDSKYSMLASKFGGYWKYPGLKDYFYLVNPYFPSQSMIKKMENELPKLISGYPSGQAMQDKNLSRLLNVSEEFVVAGNGAAELISALGVVLTGKKIAVGVPTFNEYVRCFKKSEIQKIDNSKHDYGYNINDYCDATINNDVLCIVNPDNPSGSFIDYQDMLELIKVAEKNNCLLVIDESFVDFADEEKYYTLINEDILLTYPNLIVVKSLGKSYGIGGLRLGAIACSNTNLLSEIKSKMQIWNINSIAEYFLQISNIYAKDYKFSCRKIAQERKKMIERLSQIKGTRVYPSEANYLLIDLKNTSSKKFCADALSEANIFLKDLSTKDYFSDKNFIRLAIRNEKDNDYVLDYIENKLKQKGKN